MDNVRQHDEAKRLSHTDPLTGLYNYRHLKELLRREVHRAARFGHSLAVLVMDLDRFKQVNDTYGHAAGDAVLVEFARRIGIEIRGVDVAFRYGGEEFVLLLPETDALGGITLAQRLGASVREVPVAVPGGHAAATSDVVRDPGDRLHRRGRLPGARHLRRTRAGGRRRRPLRGEGGRAGHVPAGDATDRRRMTRRRRPARSGAADRRDVRTDGRHRCRSGPDTG